MTIVAVPPCCVIDLAGRTAAGESCKAASLLMGEVHVIAKGRDPIRVEGFTHLELCPGDAVPAWHDAR